MCFADAVAHLDEEVELLLVGGVMVGQSGVLEDFEGLFYAFPVDAEASFVHARYGLGTPVGGGVQHHSGEVFEAWIAHVPYEAVTTGFDGQCAAAVLRRIAVGADEVSVGFQQVEFHLDAVGNGFEIEVEEDTIGVVFPLGAQGSLVAAFFLGHAVGGFGLEEVEVFGGYVCIQLVQRAEVIHHPEATAVGSSDEGIVADVQVGDGGDGQVQLEGVPAGTVVKGYIHAPLGTRVE